MHGWWVVALLVGCAVAMDVGPVRNTMVTCERTSATSVTCGGEVYSTEQLDREGSRKWYIDLTVSVCLILTAGLVAGLTMGLMAQDAMNLEILCRSGTDTQKKHAKTILPLISKHHLLLVTLLLINASANEALPLFLDKLLPPAATIIVSVTAVLLFGEILPQAVCTRYGLAIGAALSPVVWLLMAVTLPISWPIAKVLDAALGGHQVTYFRRAQLAELVDIHAQARGEETGPDGAVLTGDECAIIRGALEMKAKTAEMCMTPMDKVTWVNFEDKMDYELMKRLKDAGNSRVLVYHRDVVMGMILVKELILLDPKECTPVAELDIRLMPTISTKEPLFELLNLFQKGQSHLAVVKSDKDHITPLGIVSLEDIIEELIQEEIYDESDARHDERIRMAHALHRAGETVGADPTGISRRTGSLYSSDGRTASAYALSVGVNNEPTETASLLTPKG